MDDQIEHIPDSDADLLAELALTSGPRARAGRGEDARPRVLRELTASDVAQLESGERRGNALAPQPIEVLTYRHHQAARMLASGAKVVDVAYATGYTPQRVGQLARDDPGFKELLAHYAGQVEAKYLGVHERLGAVGMLAVDRIAQRLEDDTLVAGLSVKTLREVAEMALDRSIAPSIRAGTTVNVGQGAAAQGSGLNININFGDAPGATSAPTLDLTAEPQASAQVSNDD